MDTGSMLAGCCRPVLRGHRAWRQRDPVAGLRDQLGGTLSIKQSHSWGIPKAGGPLGAKP